MTDATSNYQQRLTRLLSSSRTLHLASISEQSPDASLVPYVLMDKQFWVFVSELSNHTHYLKTGKEVSVLIYDNETPATNPFATFRAVLRCTPQIMDATEHAGVLDVMTAKLGDTVSLLRQLGDFYLFSLAPVAGRLVAGFGQAFVIDCPQLTINEQPLGKRP